LEHECRHDHTAIESFHGLLTVDELAAYLKVPVATIYAWRHRSVGPEGIRVGRYIRFRAEDVETWLSDQQTESSHEMR
jgi:excisionase family DNA binding protein